MVKHGLGLSFQLCVWQCVVQVTERLRVSCSKDRGEEERRMEEGRGGPPARRTHLGCDQQC